MKGTSVRLVLAKRAVKDRFKSSPKLAFRFRRFYRDLAGVKFEFVTIQTLVSCVADSVLQFREVWSYIHVYALNSSSGYEIILNTICLRIYINRHSSRNLISDNFDITFLLGFDDCN